MPAALAFMDQFWLTLLLVVPSVLVARAAVARTRYSPILIIVVFGLGFGAVLVATGMTGPGLPELDLLHALARTAVIALVASFFVGGQELRRLFGGASVAPDTSFAPDHTEVVLGTGRTHLFFIASAFFVLLGVDAISRLLLGTGGDLAPVLPLLAFLGIVFFVILIDPAARIDDRRRYLAKGIVEYALLSAAIILATWLSWQAQSMAPFPPILFAMLMSLALGWLFPHWRHGPALRTLLFAGIPVVLAANFVVGGSLLLEAVGLEGMTPILLYGFFGQLMWMFGGISLLMLLGGTAQVRNLAPGMAGALSHTGITGACTAGEMGEVARNRAPMTIAVPFLGHVFLFTILTLSLDTGELLLWPTALAALAGVAISGLAFRVLRRAAGNDRAEVKGLLLFSLGYQLMALFGGLLLLSGLALADAAMATSSALSHFGLFAALQGGLLGAEAAALIAFVFAMPFLVHPLVFFAFGRAMQSDGQMPRRPIYALALLGCAGVAVALLSGSGAG
jgi:hypothetical protein